MSEILPNLYLGSLKVAKDATFLRDKKIKLVVSCGVFASLGRQAGITYIQLPIKDNYAAGQISECIT